MDMLKKRNVQKEKVRVRFGVVVRVRKVQKRKYGPMTDMLKVDKVENYRDRVTTRANVRG
jgi:hypothetical protein